MTGSFFTRLSLRCLALTAGALACGVGAFDGQMGAKNGEWKTYGADLSITL